MRTTPASWLQIRHCQLVQLSLPGLNLLRRRLQLHCRSPWVCPQLPRLFLRRRLEACFRQISPQMAVVVVATKARVTGKARLKVAAARAVKVAPTTMSSRRCLKLMPMGCRPQSGNVARPLVTCQAPRQLNHPLSLRRLVTRATLGRGLALSGRRVLGRTIGVLLWLTLRR